MSEGKSMGNHTAKERLRILEYAKNISSVTAACTTFGISRTLFYRWKCRYEAHGLAGLEPHPPKKPTMPNQVDALTEKALLEQLIKTPKDGPRQLCYALSKQGYRIGETGVYKVMKRHGLTRREARLAYTKSHAHQRSDLRQLTKLDVKLKQPQNQIPGYLVMETLREWTPPKGKNRLFFYALYDVHSRWGLIKLFPDQSKIHLSEFYTLNIAPLIKTFRIPIHNILSEQLPAFQGEWEQLWQAGKLGTRGHKDSRFWEVPLGKSDLIQPLNAFIDKIFGAVERVICEKTQLAQSQASLKFDELELVLENCLKTYNFKQIQGEKIPSDIILAYIESQGIDLETLPLWVHLRMV